MLFELTDAYRAIHREKETLIAKKKNYNSAWFRRRMGFLASQQDILNMAISIGKGLGDSFAWLFYHDDRRFLAEHLAKEPIFHSPPGVGGLAELEFAKNVPIINEYFLLHHCTTNILRLGDVSLFDRKTRRVVGLGEIKAGRPEAGIARVHVHLSGPALLPPDGARIIKQSDSPRSVDVSKSLTPDGRLRLKRQMAEIGKSLSVLTKDSQWKAALEHDNFIEEIDVLVDSLRPGRTACRRIGSGLMVFAYRRPQRCSLYRWLSHGRDSTANIVPMDLPERVLEIALPQRPDNSLHVGSLYYDEKGRTSHVVGMSHFVWWPLKPETIRKILFHEVLIITIFNPVHLWAALEAEGFTVKESASNKYDIFKSVDGKRMELHGIHHFMHMISHYLFSEEAVIQILKEVAAKTNEARRDGDTKVEIFVQQMFGRPPDAAKM